jgi:hypothetical protein
MSEAIVVLFPSGSTAIQEIAQVERKERDGGGDCEKKHAGSLPAAAGRAQFLEVSDPTRTSQNSARNSTLSCFLSSSKWFTARKIRLFVGPLKSLP